MLDIWKMAEPGWHQTLGDSSKHHAKSHSGPGRGGLAYVEVQNSAILGSSGKGVSQSTPVERAAGWFSRVWKARCSVKPIRGEGEKRPMINGFYG